MDYKDYQMQLFIHMIIAHQFKKIVALLKTCFIQFKNGTKFLNSTLKDGMKLI